MAEKLTYIGQIVSLDSIPYADFIVSATVFCGEGGKWKGIVQKDQFKEGDLCIVYLPDALLPPSSDYEFMKSHGWRVRMQRFRGAPSEVLIMPNHLHVNLVGIDVTANLSVEKYIKHIPPNLDGIVVGEIPEFIQKTDEIYYQAVPDQIRSLKGQPYYITEKVDGTSCTVYKHKGHFGVCGRKWEIQRNVENGYWKIALDYGLEENLPEGFVIQYEIAGPKIEKNNLGLKEISPFAFNVYDINKKSYLPYFELCCFLEYLDFPMVNLIHSGASFSAENIYTLGEGTYSNGKQREGVVVRSIGNLLGHKPVSFKVINLNYEK